MLYEAPNTGVEVTTADLHLGLAYRQTDSPLVLSRLDFGFESDPLVDAQHGTWKIVNNTIVNLTPRPDLQVSLQLGLKYAIDAIGTQRYRSFTGLAGSEVRFDLSQRCDLGLRASALITLPADTLQYAFGPSLGYSLTEAIWISAGCNLTGFDDEDFSAAGYNAAGLFVQFRLRFEPANARQLQNWFDGF